MSGLPHPLANGHAPAWASAWGQDEFGPWAEIWLPAADDKDVVQRLRWMSPGVFRMGSPEDEPGRYDDEGPTRQVQLTCGFWLFDTPCTQALWLAVMGGKNPARFQSPERPVERVNIEDIGRFTDKLAGLLPGEPKLRLPTEAEWEYACRAGTDTGTWLGELDGDEYSQVLDRIGWYGGNCDQGFELKNPVKPYWNNKQGGTHPVKGKEANPWGLYDLLGNVWEWCADGWQDRYGGAGLEDPLRQPEAGGVRVLRGGSWSSLARRLRAACRGRNDPGYRGVDTGFRLALVQK